MLTPRQRDYFIALIAAAVFVAFWHLGSFSLQSWDEAIYAESAKEMLSSHNWLTPHWNYAPLFHKPPLVMWLTAGLFSLFGVSEFTARMVAALSGVGLVALTYLIARRLFDEWVALLSGAVLIASAYFHEFARHGSTDMPLALLILIAVYAYLRARDNAQWWLAVGASFGLALMTKGVAAAVVPMVLFVSLILDHRLKELRSKYLWLGVLLALLIALPWHIAMVLTHGQAFLSEYLGYQVIARATSTLENGTSADASNSLYYLTVLTAYFFPWVFVPFASALAITNQNLRTALKSDSRVLIALAVVVFGLYTLVRTKLPWYLLPAIPALAVYVACLLVYFARHSRVVGVVLCIALLVVGFANARKPIRFDQSWVEAEARLGKLASKDEGPLATAPGIIAGPTILFYSNRRICAFGSSHFSPLEDSVRCSEADRPADVIYFNELKPIELERFALQDVIDDEPYTYALLAPK